MPTESPLSSAAWQSVITGMQQNLLTQGTNTSILKALASLPSSFSPLQLIELHLPEGYYRYFADGHVENSTTCYQGTISDSVVQTLHLSNDSPVELRFIRTDGGKFSEADSSQFAWLARVIMPALESVIEQARLTCTVQSLERLRNHHRILVAITNSVLSHLDIDELAEEVAKEIHHFFGIHLVSMVLRDSLRSNQLVAHDADFSAPVAEHQQYVVPCESPTMQRVFKEKHTCRRDVQDAEWQQDPLLQKIQQQGYNSAFFLPLAFGEQTTGVLILAHQDASVFTEDHCQLLQQIADRVAIAVDNADALRNVTHLKENLKNENKQLSDQLFSRSGSGDIMYQSQAMADVIEQINIVSQINSTVLILGETGTGKELIARAIHQLSDRKNKSLVKINCAAIPATLLESELFGHEKGAFTGAINSHRGRFEMADEGTLFLDEIGDLPLELQPKLLRVLQEREIERLGGHRVIPVNVRVIAATNRDLKQMVIDREFRDDLFYRLNVFPLYLPALRERPEDIPLLAKFFTQKLARRMNRSIDTIPSDAMRQLMQYDWPGNVRELENVIERAVILTRGSSLNLQLNERLVRPSAPVAEHQPFEQVAKIMHTAPPENDEAERQRIIQMLRETNGIVAGPRGAAMRLGMKRTTLLSRMQRLGITPREVL